MNIVYMFRQGQTFKKYQNKYNNLVKSTNLDSISLGKLNIVNNLRFKNYKNIEGFSGEDKVETVNEQEVQKLTNLENEFNKTMGEYLNKYKKYLEEYLNNENFTRIEFKDVVGLDTFYTLSLHRPRQFDSSCEFHVADYKVTCEVVEVVSRNLRNTKIIMSYINKCSSGI